MYDKILLFSFLKFKNNKFIKSLIREKIFYKIK